jgi:hypothetical protein
LRIISDFPEIFAEFRKKRFLLLWRGSRGGFKEQEFHRRCNDRANTLTIILDTKGNIFGGLTPVEWESWMTTGNGSNCWKADDNLKSFAYTLKNSHDVPGRGFSFKADVKGFVIDCQSEFRPCFGGSCDIAVYGNCNRSTKSFIDLATLRRTTPDRTDDLVVAGSADFQVTEKEVFEITAYTALH